MVKYKAKFWWEPKIEKIEIEKETESFVFFRNKKEKKKTQDYVYFDSFDEAKAHLIQVYEGKATDARRALEMANSYLGNAKGLKDA
jgi:hypothetical protein